MIYLLVILSSILKNIVFEAALGDNLVLEVSQEFHIVVHLASFERQNTSPHSARYTARTSNSPALIFNPT